MDTSTVGGSPVQAPAPVAPQQAVATQGVPAQAPAQAAPVAPAPVYAPTPVAPVQPVPTPAELPQGTSQRTSEQFEKLVDSNHRLNEAYQLLQQQLAQKAQMEQQYARPQPVAPVVQPQVQPQQQDPFVEVDPYTGEQTVRVDKLKQALDESTQRAVRTEQALQTYIEQQRKEEENRQTNEAYRAHPELNPVNADKYSPDFIVRTRRILVDSVMSPQDYGGRPYTFKEAADIARQELNMPTAAAPVATPATQQAVNTQVLENREQAALAAQGSSSQAQPPIDPMGEDKKFELRMKTRKGGMDGTWALAERLSGIDHTGTPKSSTEA